MSNLHPINCDMDFRMPPSVDDWLAAAPRFVMEVVGCLDQRSRWSAFFVARAMHPTCRTSSPKLERATYDSRRATGSRRKRARSSTRCCKQTPEPVFGIIKSVLGFRQFLQIAALNLWASDAQ